MTVSRETVSPWGSLCGTISNSSYYDTLFSNDKLTVLKKCLPGFTALLFAARYAEEKQGFVIVTEESVFAEKFYFDFQDLLPGSVYFAPNINTKIIRPSIFVSEEERSFDTAYSAIISKTHPIVITTKGALKNYVRPQDQAGTRIKLESGCVVTIKTIINALGRWGYEAVDSTIAPGSFSVRGGILDIFPLYASCPIRVEYFSDTIESIRQFNPVSQLSISPVESFELLAPSGYYEDNKTEFKKFLRDCSLQFYYLKNDSRFLSIANNNSYKGGAITVDNISNSVDRLERKNGMNVFMLGVGNSYQKKLKNNIHSAIFVNNSLRKGFISNQLNLAVFGYGDLNFLKPLRSSESVPPHEQPTISSFANFSWGDYIVHEDYGVGVYRGLSVLEGSGSRQDSIAIEYSGGNVVRVALDRLNKIHKYVSKSNKPVELSRLGSKSWQNRLLKAKKSVESIVEDLIEIYSSRKNPRGFNYTKDNEFLELLSASFHFDETPDQLSAINDVLNDLNKRVPMDRVIMGDVGFGKTEVALRAAMKVIASSKQVFVLAPTTILVDQHFITANNRLVDLGVRVNLLSRFQSKKEQLSVLEHIKNRTTDLVIGTHRLLSKDVDTKNLGLLIIDEEQRFGAQHKEHIRVLKKNVDVLTLTATPIPRTLQQSLIGVRDVSRINTPPRERLPIKTTVQYFSWTAVKLQIHRELKRGGQVFFLHNNIQSIPFVVEKIKKLFPDSVVAGAHGSMPSKALENIMLSFYKGAVNILVCTTIIESGLDITNANTVIINNAHRFGLAQLYQVRGRVGRGRLQAYCWLLIPNKTLNDSAYKRLKTIEYYSALGSGYQLAVKDLEMRGAGSLFGYEQSGHINSIGYSMYCKLLKDRVDERLKKEQDKPARPTIVFGGSAYFSASYIPLAQDRVYYYQRLAVASNVEDVSAVYGEIVDRFGRMPDESENVVAIAKIRELFLGSGVKKITLASDAATISFTENQGNTAKGLVAIQNLLSLSKRTYRFQNNGGFAALIETVSINDALKFAMHFAKLMRAGPSV